MEVVRSAGLAGVAHGFLGRRGGVSQGAVAGLNVGLGSADDPAAVAENRARAAAAVLPGARLVGLYQVHSPTCVVAGDWAEADRPHADALVTDRPGLLLGILTADCAPVLFADVAAGVVGAAHAGWKGAFTGVCEATVAAMEKLGARAERITAAIGPCIAQSSYEVDETFRQRFVQAGEWQETHFLLGREGHWQFDLSAYVAHRIRAAGVVRIDPLNIDTYLNEDRFFSFRRSTHQACADYGRQISLIGLD
ncbi:peptidoglycan editing factor PgeF [Novosphingobium sp. FSY-8]|uniref:Purine nucleoside phosphorylase n=1 Tax=Novosphingobium ovatum TaxID=1908523 RepID=A0ABW9XEI7_9SPHN|nr:peptidoglycan editing factor PgeF [Novosphingobium ovatum]